MSGAGDDRERGGGAIQPGDLPALARAGRLALPPPGGGRTGRRFATLYDWGRRDLTLARLVEAHADAVAICAELGSEVPDGLLGVWASDGPASRLEARRVRSGWRLDGAKAYCSGARWVSHALVTARRGDGVELFVLPVDAPGVSFDSRGWVSVAFAATWTAAMTADGVELPPEARVGPPGGYLRRPGFWHGAVGVAACWAGGAAGLADRLAARPPSDAHTAAHLGAVGAVTWSLRAALGKAADEIDADPDDRSATARARALAVRHVVEAGCVDVLGRFGRAAGPGPLAFDADCSRRVAELTLYIRQSHAERDLEELGRALASGSTPPTSGRSLWEDWSERGW